MTNWELRRRRALDLAVAEFIRRLVAHDLAGRAVRLETRLCWPSTPDGLFLAEAAMAAAWSCTGAALPAHELAWVGATRATREAGGGLRIRALDARGAVLLDSGDGAEPRSAGAQPVEGGRP